MGVDAKCYIYSYASPDMIGAVAARLLGNPPAENYFNAEGVQWRSHTPVISPAFIDLLVKQPASGRTRWFSLFMDAQEWNEEAHQWAQTGRYFELMCRANATAIAVFTKLAKFFGGFVDFNDCDSVYADVTFPAWENPWTPSDGGPYHAMLTKLAGVKSLTTEDYEAALAVASYPYRDWEPANASA